MPVEITQEAVEQAMPTRNNNDVGDVLYPRPGNSYFTVVERDDAETFEDVMATAKNFFSGSEKMSNKHVAFVLMLKADDMSKYPDDTSSSAYPFVMPVTLGRGVANALADVDMGYTTTVIDANGAVVRQGTIFKVTRTGTGLDTEYSVLGLPPNNPRYESLPDSIIAPERTLKEVAQAITERATYFYEQENPPVPETPPSADDL